MFSTIRPASLRSKNLYTTAILLCILFLSGQAWSQTSYLIELRVVAHGNNYWDGNSNGARYRLFRESSYGSDQWYNLLYSCLSSGANTTAYPNYPLNAFMIDVNAPPDSSGSGWARTMNAKTEATTVLPREPATFPSGIPTCGIWNRCLLSTSPIFSQAYSLLCQE